MNASTFFFGLAVALGGAGLIARHVLSWRAAQRRPLDDEEREFRRLQFRRRVQASAMIALAGVGLACEPLVEFSPLIWAIYVLVLIVLLFWIVALALADAVATRFHYGRERDDLKVKKVVLEAELRRRRNKTTGNGHAGGKKPR